MYFYWRDFGKQVTSKEIKIREYFVLNLPGEIISSTINRKVTGTHQVLELAKTYEVLGPEFLWDLSPNLWFTYVS